MSYLYQAKPGNKGYWKGKIRLNDGKGNPEVFRSDKKLKEFPGAWYELVDTGDASQGDDEVEKAPEHVPNLIAEAFVEMDHADDDQWTAKGEPKMDVLNKHYQGETALTKSDIAPLNLKRRSDDDQ